jgi:hypothetical protein
MLEFKQHAMHQFFNLALLLPYCWCLQDAAEAAAAKMIAAAAEAAAAKAKASKAASQQEAVSALHQV